MNDRPASARARDEGFTLVELLVVVVIIGVLAAVAIPAFLTNREKAWTAAVQSDMRHAINAAEGYAAQHGSYDGLDEKGLEDNGYRPSNAVTVSVEIDVDPSDNAYSISATSSAFSPARTWTFSSETGEVTE